MAPNLLALENLSFSAEGCSARPDSWAALLWQCTLPGSHCAHPAGARGHCVTALLLAWGCERATRLINLQKQNA